LGGFFIADFRLPIADLPLLCEHCTSGRDTSTAKNKSAIGNRQLAWLWTR